MAQLKDIVEFLDSYLNTAEISDSSWNGLQIEGRSEVKKIMFAVDAGVEVFERAIKEEVDMIVVHHGIFWTRENPTITGWKKKRFDMLYSKGISLYASHLPLDVHAEVGNNAELVKMLGAKIVKEFGQHEGILVARVAEFPEAVSIDDIKDRLSGLGGKMTVLPFGPEKIKTIALCSGGGGYGIFFEARDLGVDAYLSGDSVEVYHAAQDAGINVVFAGHHATETTGVKALSKVVDSKFDVEVKFVDIPTGL
jgi:dinuclear metal center YbgI/SA1388 family protein